ncbi:MAG TPA: metal-sensitive transcriptional regulator [Phycisphaerales bacterium]|nr:metal-sensitive transcriptional regulator [Phycisphaerales bacterium]
MPSKNDSTPSPACGCHSDPAAPGERLAHAVDADLKAANTLRLKRAEGQVRGIARMIEQDRYCADIITQITAVQESLRVVAKNLLKNHMKHCASAALTSGDAKAQTEMIDELTDLMSKIAR